MQIWNRWLKDRVSIALLRIEKWSAKIFAVFESFVYRFAANSFQIDTAVLNSFARYCRLASKFTVP